MNSKRSTLFVLGVAFSLVAIGGSLAWAGADGGSGGGSTGGGSTGGGVPEIGAGSAVSALVMLSGGILLVTDRIRKSRSRR